MLKMGDLRERVAMADSIVDQDGRDRALVDIATVHANARRWDDAMKAVESIRGDAARFVALNRVGVARGKAKDARAAGQLFSRALEIGKGLKLDGQPDPTAAYNVALAQAETGDYRAARQTLRGSDPEIVAEEVADVIAGTQARAGDFSKALLTLQSLPPSSQDGYSESSAKSPAYGLSPAMRRTHSTRSTSSALPSPGRAPHGQRPRTRGPNREAGEGRREASAMMLSPTERRVRFEGIRRFRFPSKPSGKPRLESVRLMFRVGIVALRTVSTAL